MMKTILTVFFAAWLIANFIVYRTGLYEHFFFQALLTTTPCVLSGAFLYELLEECKVGKKLRTLLLKLITCVLLLSIGCVYLWEFTHT